jgi:hypothetical protein
MGLAPYVREGYRPAIIIPGLLRGTATGVRRRGRAVPGAGEVIGGRSGVTTGPFGMKRS